MKINLKHKNKNFYDVYDYDINYHIGVVELFIDGGFWLNKIDVFSDCQRKGYGRTIIKYLVDNYSPFKISLSNKTAHYHNHDAKNSEDTRCLTSDGFQLVKNCFETGILKMHHFIFPFPNDILVQYKSDSFLDNLYSNIQNLVNPINNFLKDKPTNNL